MGAYSFLWSATRLALVLPLLLAFGGGAALAQQDTRAQQETQAQRLQVQPGNNAPVWREVRKEGQEHYTSIKGRETGVLIQSLGETWRELRNSWIVPIAGWFFVAFACVLGLYYLTRGPWKLRVKPTGRLIERFKPVERAAHWTMAISFCILGVSGLIMMVGKYVLLPVIGHTLFAWLADLAKLLHNFVGPVFVVSIVVFIVLFVKEALPRAGDLIWLIKAGGWLTGEDIPSHKMNAGQKMWFWGGVVAMSSILGVTGLIMDFPNFDQTRSTMIYMNIIHSVFGGLIMALSLYHIYMGTIGVEAAYKGMRFGYVDETYAKEHHEFWYEDVKSGKIKTEFAEGVPEAPRGLSKAPQGLHGVGEST